MDQFEDKMNQLNDQQSVKRGRGRPPKNGSSVQKPIIVDSTEPIEESRTVIIDPVIAPYKIIVTEHSFNVVDEVRPVGAIADSPYGYFSTLDNALLRIAKLKTTKNKTYSLKEYINEWKQLIESLRSTIK